MTAEFHHVPVLLHECLEGLAIRPDGAYLDCTLGGGGHSSEIFSRLREGGVLAGIDRDDEALAAAAPRVRARGAGGRFLPIKGNFHDAKELLAGQGIAHLDGALMDLGVSSHQFDDASRGFSYRADAPLDMRMDQTGGMTAADIVNSYSEKELTRVLWDWAEEKWAARIAKFIVEERAQAPVRTTGELVGLIDRAIPKKVREKDGSHPARKTFQALRIEVNDELRPLEKAIGDIVELLAPGGRIAVIAFHSLEDRIVKNTFRTLADPCTCPKSFPVCVCGKKPQVRIITKKPIVSGEDELADNPRARSATLRIAQKI
ncbi:MAG: 16S rRNA (cytosine(1402)-N(4))-methyltransferase RsmH [Eubacteriales bacterium]|nr:16S rRNA (cytosine(1402)-N(4))-methyltransferase RsmH [Eubacteriales bacterium]